MTVLARDPLRKSVEKATDGKCTVLYTSKGWPTCMTIIPAFKCEDLAPDLGTGLHPAFIVGGKKVSEIMIGTYLSIIHDGQALSLPYQIPQTSINHDDAINACRAGGPGFHMMTNWEWSALALWCMKHGLPRGNTDYGASHSYPEEKGMICEDGKTMTGSGPVTWRHDGTIAGIADLVGNVWEHQDGLKLVNGKIIMPADNDFTMPEKDWPDTGARLDDVDAIRISDEITRHVWLGCPFKDVSIKKLRPVALQQALIAPSSLTKADHTEPLGYMWADNEADERIPLRGGNWTIASTAGLAALSLTGARSIPYTSIGFRLAYIG